MAARTPAQSDEVAQNLSTAIVTSSPGPLLLLDGELKIVAASASFLDAFGIDAQSAAGHPLAALGAGEWDGPQLLSWLDAIRSGSAPVEVYEMDLARPGHASRHLVIHARRLAYLDREQPRLLVTVSDVTDARADANLKDEALRQNLVRLQEVRHRVANSLQIIASVLLQSAKRCQSDETRDHLKNAHHRVMSVAALERQLVESGADAVELRTYFSNLCDSIGASMIGDPDQISLTVSGPGGVVDARAAVSLGLIVTELVINALKHAFPGGRSGKIVVDCEFHGPNWTLSVTDDGVGLLAVPADVRSGLGASIVQALAIQLQATVEIEPANPGLRVAITHTQIALVDGVTGDANAMANVNRPAA